MNKPVKITEKQLHNIVNESVSRILAEGQSARQLQHIIDALTELTISGWIPFSSPSPSSTEQIVKDNVLQAISCLKKAQAATIELYGRE